LPPHPYACSYWLLLTAGIWWIYLLAYGAFPITLSSDLLHLFDGIVARNPQYWLYLLLLPPACLLPDFFVRQMRRCEARTRFGVKQG
jgi:phospholipid-transporting ATPase